METTICGLTEKAIVDLKKEHGVLFVVEISEGDNSYKAVCKEPTVTIMTAVNAIAKTDEIKGTMVLFTSCLIACDEDINKRDVLKLQVAGSISERMTNLTRSVKNL